VKSGPNPPTPFPEREGGVRLSSPYRGGVGGEVRATALLTVVAAALRVVPWLTGYPLHRDEALYGFWARLIASGTDPLLLTAWVDKPPLVIYTLAGSLKAFGISRLTLRLPGMIASILTVPLVYGLARRAYGRRVALLAGLLVAISPFAILFAPTAFTDPWLTLWLVASAWTALAGQSFWAGLMLGLAVASKQQGVLGVPLVLGLLALRGTLHPELRGTMLAKRLLFSLLGFLMVFAPLTYWDSLRWTSRPSFWDRSLVTYGGLGLAPLAQWYERAIDWAKQLGYLFGLPSLSALMLLTALAVGMRAGWCILANRPSYTAAVRRPGRTRPGRPCRTREQGPVSPAMTPRVAWATDLIFSLYLVGYLVLHFLFTFQPWDRYLLPLVPLISILAARGISLAWHWLARWDRQRVGRTAGVVAGVLLLSYAAWLGVAGKLPIGSDHGAYAGLDHVIATLRAQPADTIIYHRWLGWHYDFYLFDAPQERRWWGSGWKLADDAARTARAEPDRPQWLALPAWKDAAANELRTALSSRGLALAEVERIYRPDGSRSFTLYRIVPVGGRDVH